MKWLLSLLVCLFVTNSWAQQKKHMIEFNADSIVNGSLNFTKTKNRSSSEDNGSELNLVLNYAYSVAPKLQIGTRLNYIKDAAGTDIENWGAEFGGIFNFQQDMMNTIYASLFLGLQWNRTFGPRSSADEIRKGTLAFGKRFALNIFGLDHVTWSPEIALQNLNSTTNSSLDYAQSLEFRFLQFSVLF